MALNIKNQETHRLALELAALTGQTVTDAVKDALRQRLESLRGQSSEEVAGRLMDIGKDCASRWKSPLDSQNHGDYLYDERGLPR